MSSEDVKSYDQLTLPTSVASKLDISRLVNEVEQLDSYLVQAQARTKAGATSEASPILSDQLTDFLAANQIDTNDNKQRKQLLIELRKLKTHAPIIHMTFAGGADQDSLGKLADWLRQSIHPQAVIEVGLQPSLVGGVYIRTTNHVHDMSIRAQLANKRGLLVEELEALGGQK